MPGPPPPETLATPQVVAYVLVDLALIVLAARALGSIFVRLRLSRLGGEILAGILIGPTLLGGQIAKGPITALDRPGVAGEGIVNDIFPLQAFSILDVLATLAVVALLFMVGLEVSRRYLARRALAVGAVALAAVAVSVAVGFLVANILDSSGEWKVELTPEGRPVTFPTHGLFVGAAMAVTAFPFVARLLQRRRVLGTRMGSLAFGAAVAATPLGFIILATASASIRQQGVPGNVAVKIAAAVALLVFLFAVVRPLARIVLARYFQADRPMSGTIFTLLVVGALASALAAERIGIHAICGGFLFGACIPHVEGLGRAVRDRLLPITAAVLVPVLFAVVGLQSDFRVLDGGLLAGLLLFLAAMLLAKLAAGAVASRAAGLEWREAGTVGVLLGGGGVMVAAVALVGLQAGVTAPMMAVAFASAALLTTLLSGPVAGYLIPQDTVDVRRESAIKSALAGVLPEGDAKRVLVAPTTTAAATAVFAAAHDHAADAPRPAFLVVGIPGLDEDGELVGAGPEEGRGLTRAARPLLQLGAEGLRAAGADVWVACFASPAPAEDLAKLARDWGASRAIAPPGPEAEAMASAGVAVERVGT